MHFIADISHLHLLSPTAKVLWTWAPSSSFPKIREGNECLFRNKHRLLRSKGLPIFAVHWVSQWNETSMEGEERRLKITRKKVIESYHRAYERDVITGTSQGRIQIMKKLSEKCKQVLRLWLAPLAWNPIISMPLRGNPLLGGCVAEEFGFKLSNRLLREFLLCYHRCSTNVFHYYGMRRHHQFITMGNNDIPHLMKHTCMLPMYNE